MFQLHDCMFLLKTLLWMQGEDVVAGIRTPKPIAQLRDDFPEIYAQLRRTCDRLEEYFKDMQDVEFTVQEGTLFILQTRNGKRSGAAAVAIAVDMVEQGLISMEEAILQVTPEHLDTMLHNQFTNVHAVEYTSAVIAKGLNASPGAAVGVACFSSAEVEHKRKDGISAILIRHETSPEDVAGMFAADGILTARGGKTSHAAVVARGWGKTCVCGVGESMVVDEEKREASDALKKKGRARTRTHARARTHTRMHACIRGHMHHERTHMHACSKPTAYAGPFKQISSTYVQTVQHSLSNRQQSRWNV
uniref:Pyruvate, phosphate dikinase n=2 Tax=Chrysotila carterae TaxID=13221 RepID=A0A6T0CG17_CHRCT